MNRVYRHFCGCRVNGLYWVVKSNTQKAQHPVSVLSYDFIRLRASCIERFVALLAHKATHLPTTLFSCWQQLPNKVVSGEFFFSYSALGLEVSCVQRWFPTHLNCLFHLQSPFGIYSQILTSDPWRQQGVIITASVWHPQPLSKSFESGWGCQTGA